MSIWDDNEDPIIAAERQELRAAKAENARLRAEKERLRLAIQPFASPPLYVFDNPNGKWVPSSMPDHWIGGGWFSTQEFVAAHAALKDTTP